MMGERRVAQDALFYEFSLERHVPQDHLLRKIDALVSFDGVRAHLAPYYSDTGRPSICPELMIRMLLIGYCLGIRSERRICEEVHLNLAYRWFCRLGLGGAVPDHSTFSKNRHGRFRESGLFRHVFDDVLRRCMEAGLVGGDAFAVDASMIEADANRSKGGPGSEGLPEGLRSRAIEEYIATLDDAAFGAASLVTPKFLSPSDPASRWSGAHRGPAMYAYSLNYLIDVDNAVIVDVEGTTAIRQAEVTAAMRMIDRVEDRHGLYPDRLIGDTAYGSAELLGWMVGEKGIEPHVPVFDKSARDDGTFSRSDFAFDHENDCYVCPAGKLLGTSGSLVNDDTTYLYRASTRDCSVCPLKARCCPKSPVRKIPRSIHEGARDLARELAMTEAYAQSRRDRKKVEMLFAHLKRILGLRQLRLRGPTGANDEFLLAATAQNLRKLAKLVHTPA